MSKKFCKLRITKKASQLIANVRIFAEQAEVEELRIFVSKLEEKNRNLARRLKKIREINPALVEECE